MLLIDDLNFLIRNNLQKTKIHLLVYFYMKIANIQLVLDLFIDEYD